MTFIDKTIKDESTIEKLKDELLEMLFSTDNDLITNYIKLNLLQQKFKILPSDIKLSILDSLSKIINNMKNNKIINKMEFDSTNNTLFYLIRYI